MNEKVILDACCGCRQFWFDKKNPNVLFIDKRKEAKGFQDARPNKEINPDLILDFRNLPFKDRSFKLVVFDPPHLLADGPTYRMTKEYGWLDRKTWREDLTKGFNECWRVLEDYGVLIFKWNECSIKKKEVLSLFSQQPLFGHPILSKTKTHWITFMKIPSITQPTKQPDRTEPIDFGVK